MTNRCNPVKSNNKTNDEIDELTKYNVIFFKRELLAILDSFYEKSHYYKFSEKVLADKLTDEFELFYSNFKAKWLNQPKIPELGLMQTINEMRVVLRYLYGLDIDLDTKIQT